MSKQSPLCAAQYLRMSTDVQDLSLAIQRQAIQEYLQAHAMQLVASSRTRGAAA